MEVDNGFVPWVFLPEETTEPYEVPCAWDGAR